jgi:hypothetical protein
MATTGHGISAGRRVAKLGLAGWPEPASAVPARYIAILSSLASRDNLIGLGQELR